MDAVDEHRSRSPRTLKVAIFTASTSRYAKIQKGEEVQDDSGMTAVNLLKNLGHAVEYLGIVNDDVAMIREKLFEALSHNPDVVLVTGGTGLARRDLTIEAIKPLLEKEIEGFGEIFRFESYKRIGPAAALSRATAGTINKKVVLVLPGSPEAVKMAIEIFGKELPHFVHIAGT